MVVVLLAKRTEAHKALGRRVLCVAGWSQTQHHVNSTSRTKWLRWRRLVPRRLCCSRLWGCCLLLLALRHQLLWLVGRRVAQHHKSSRNILQRHVSSGVARVEPRITTLKPNAPAGCDAPHIALLRWDHTARVFKHVAGGFWCSRCSRRLLTATCCSVTRVHRLGLAVRLASLDRILFARLSTRCVAASFTTTKRIDTRCQSQTFSLARAVVDSTAVGILATCVLAAWGAVCL